MDADDEMDGETLGRPSGGARARGSSGSRPRKRAAAAPAARKSAGGGARKMGGAKKKGGGAKKKGGGQRREEILRRPQSSPENLCARHPRRQRAGRRRRPGAGASRSQPRAARLPCDIPVDDRQSLAEPTTDDQRPARARLVSGWNAEVAEPGRHHFGRPLRVRVHVLIDIGNAAGLVDVERPAVRHATGVEHST